MAEDWLPPLDFPAYLESKRAIDSASLNPALFDRFRAIYEVEPSPRLLDLGTGTGAMLRRVLDFHPAGDAELAGLDRDPASLEQAAARIRAQLEGAGFRVRSRTSAAQWELRAEGGGARRTVRLLQGDVQITVIVEPGQIVAVDHIPGTLIPTGIVEAESRLFGQKEQGVVRERLRETLADWINKAQQPPDAVVALAGENPQGPAPDYSDIGQLQLRGVEDFAFGQLWQLWIKLLSQSVGLLLVDAVAVEDPGHLRL